MEKIFLAIGHMQVEEYLQKNLRSEFNFVGETVYREGILKGISQYNPDILVMRETLEGSSNIMDIIYSIRSSYPEIRIIFIAGKRQTGDALLATLVNYSIYDILTGETINVKDIINLVRKPNQFVDVMYLQPKTIIDEKTNKRLFEAPTTKESVYVEKETRYKDKIETVTTVEVITKTEVSDVIEIINEPLEENPKKEIEIGLKKGTIEKINIEKKPILPLKKVENLNNTTVPEQVKNKTTEPKKKIPVNQAKRPFFTEKENLFKETFSGKSTKQQILSFLGSKPGVGNTHIAISTAIKLAQRGFKTAYIDLNDKYTTMGYIYQIGEYYNGIDTALKGIEDGSYEKVDSSIVTTKSLVKNTSKDNLMLKNYKKLPENLDFMFFSQQYIQKKSYLTPTIDYNLLKDLCMYLMIQKEYDFIVLDAQSNIDNKLTEIAMANSTKIFCSISQDVSSISSNMDQLSELAKKRIILKEKIYYILNKYENATLGIKDIETWVNENIDFKISINANVPNLNKEFIEANYVGLPMILCTKNKDFLKAFSSIEKLIL